MRDFVEPYEETLLWSSHVVDEWKAVQDQLNWRTEFLADSAYWEIQTMSRKALDKINGN